MKVKGYDIRRAMGIAVMDPEKGPTYHWIMRLRPFQVRTTTIPSYFDGAGYKSPMTPQEFVQLLEKPTTNIIHEGVKSRHEEKKEAKEIKEEIRRKWLSGEGR